MEKFILTKVQCGCGNWYTTPAAFGQRLYDKCLNCLAKEDLCPDCGHSLVTAGKYTHPELVEGERYCPICFTAD